MFAILLPALMQLAKFGIGTLTTKIAAAKADVETAQTERQRIQAEERVKALEARRDVMIAEGGSPINAMIRATFALPVALYYGKIFLWDKVLALGATDPLSENLTEVAMIIIGFYFLAEGAAQMARIIKKR